MPKYKDAQGRYRTQSLFLETNITTMDSVFTLKEYDHKGCQSMKLLYLKAKDVTEYRAAMEILGSWQHWLKLVDAAWFQPYINEWRQELEVLLRSEAIEDLRKNSKDKSGKGSNAARWLAEGKWKEKKKTKRDLDKWKEHLEEDTEEDAARLGLH